MYFRLAELTENRTFAVQAGPDHAPGSFKPDTPWHASTPVPPLHPAGSLELATILLPMFPVVQLQYRVVDPSPPTEPVIVGQIT